MNTAQTSKYTTEQLSRIMDEIINALPEILQNIPFPEIIRLAEEKKLGPMINFTLRAATTTESIKAADTFKYDKVKQNWKLLEHKKDQDILPLSQLEIATPFINQEKCIFGEELIKRALKKNSDFTQHQAEYLLEHQEQIPLDWRPFCIIFPGTIWADSANRPSIPYIVYERTGWSLNYYWINRPFAAASRLLRRK